MFTLMHISDLHRSISSPISNSELISSLALDRDRCSNEQPSINNPNAIIVSGDLVQGLPIGDTGYPTDLERQYEEAFAFLEELANTFVEGDRSKVIVVPGNHDVDWSRAAAAMQVEERQDVDVRYLITDPESSYRWSWKKRRLLRIVNHETYESRFEYFCKFYDHFYKNAPLLHHIDSTRPWNFFGLDDGRILVCAFNSCVANDCYSDIGRIRPTDIADSHVELLRGQFDYSLLIGVWHHNVKGPPLKSDYLDIDTLPLLIDKGFRLGLHGHQHKSDIFPYGIHTSDGHSMGIISAGSLCVGPEALPTGVNRQYNFLEIGDDYQEGRLHIREMNIPGVFERGRIMGWGGNSYTDLKWSPKVLLGIPNAGKSGGGPVEEVDLIEQLIASGEYETALEALDSSTYSGSTYHRRLLTKALYQSEEWDRLSIHLANPTNNDELATLFTVLENLGAWSRIEDTLEIATKSASLNPLLIQELRARLRVQRALREE